MRIAFLGFGLIAGSIARALRVAADSDARLLAADGSAPGPRSSPAGGEGLFLVAWSPSGHGPREARADGTLDDAASTVRDAVAQADLVVLAGPPLSCLAMLDELARLPGGTLSPTATVTDVASTKAEILGRADALGLPFVGGHPMAGREVTGYSGSSAELFLDRPWVVVPGRAARGADVERVEWLARSCRARPVTFSAAEHDAAAAAISHVPLVVAAALAEAVAGADREALGVEWAVARALAASGWRDTTRLARGDPAMGAGIAATNGPAIERVVRLVRDELDAWLDVLAPADGTTPDPSRLADRFDRARARLAE